ncbi:MAG: flavin monoamine oxidase family protein [Dehalococcoidia bacterium]
MSGVLIHERFEPFAQADLRVDIAVVGAGVAGAYTAWRLKQSRPELKVALFESSDRVGGRLYTRTLPGMPHLHAELGGMRFVPAYQQLVAGLIEYFGLPTRDFPMGAPEPVGDSNNILYLRRHLLRTRDLVEPAKVPYFLNLIEQGKTPEQLQTDVMNAVLPNVQRLAGAEWFTATVFDGKPLYTFGFWNLLARVLSSEAYQYLSDAGGYYTNVANTNAVFALPAGTEPLTYRTLTQGYQQLPITLVERFRGDGGEVYPNCRLDSFGRHESGPYALKFVRTVTDAAHHTRDDAPEQLLKVQADRVVLALPRRSLELIRWQGFVDDPWLRANLASVISQWAFKLFLAYPYPWWRQADLQAGRSITDLPIRQTYYFGTESESGGTDAANLNSLLMVTYNDLGAVPFWKGLESGAPFEGRPNPYVPHNLKPVPPHRFPVSSQMVEAAQEQVKEMHGLIYLPEPYSAIYQDWSEDPYGAGWHGWKAGVRFWEVMPRMRHPLERENVYICGEAYSIEQGWVEGALRSAEMMLEEHFDLERPREWLPAGYHLGP